MVAFAVYMYCEYTLWKCVGVAAVVTRVYTVEVCRRGCGSDASVHCGSVSAWLR